MLFNSHEFLFLFLPITIFVFFQLGAKGYRKVAAGFLTIASLFFYGWWNPAYLALLIFSILFNYSMGAIISERITFPIASNRKSLLVFSIVANLALLGYFKYANFFTSSINSLVGTQFHLEKIILPLAISFFTFTQIAYLADAYRGETKEYNFLSYCLFVTFFPHLIAGPIVHHYELIPQLDDPKTYKFKYEDMAIGSTIFAAGLFKKVIFADNVSIYASPIFSAAAQGAHLTFFEAWIGSLAYTLQLYFDFSGYSDMAIGASRMMGVKLPLNFNSPYKAVSISDFWRRWHITLSNFLRDYIYIPLGGNRQGEVRRYTNLMTTMLLGGLWHGAGWTFIFWGGLHGAYLVIHRIWQSLRKSWGHDLSQSNWWARFLGIGITFFAVVVAWVFFRADNMEAAIAMLKGMFGFNGISLPPSLEKYLGAVPSLQFLGFLPVSQIPPNRTITSIMVLLAIAFFAPNTQDLMQNYNPALDFKTPSTESESEKHITWYHKLYTNLQWHPTPWWAIICGSIFLIGIISISSDSEFIYFQF